MRGSVLIPSPGPVAQQCSHRTWLHATILQPPTQERNIGRYCERPLTASTFCCVYTLPSPARTGDTWKKKGQTSPPKTPTDSPRLKKRISTRPARLDFPLPPATPPRKRSRQSGRGVSFKRATTFIEPGSEQRIRFGKTRYAQGAWERSPQSVSACLTLWSLTSEAKGAHSRPV